MAEIIGIFGFTATIISYQCKSRKKILLLQLISTSCWLAHFALLGAWAGAVLNLVGALRCIVFAGRGENSRAGKIADWIGWIPVFLALSAAAVAVTWTGWICILPFLGMILTTFAVRAPSAMLVRFLTLPNDPLWLIYNAMSGSVSGVITEICIKCSIITGIIRHDIPGIREKIREKKQN